MKKWIKFYLNSWWFSVVIALFFYLIFFFTIKFFEIKKGFYWNELEVKLAYFCRFLILPAAIFQFFKRQWGKGIFSIFVFFIFSPLTNVILVAIWFVSTYFTAVAGELFST